MEDPVPPMLNADSHAYWTGVMLEANRRRLNSIGLNPIWMEAGIEALEAYANRPQT